MELCCEYCDMEFSIKNGWVRKPCPCDEEERTFSLLEWYYRVFGIEVQVVSERQFSMAP